MDRPAGRDLDLGLVALVGERRRLCIIDNYIESLNDDGSVIKTGRIFAGVGGDAEITGSGGKVPWVAACIGEVGMDNEITKNKRRLREARQIHKTSLFESYIRNPLRVRKPMGPGRQKVTSDPSRRQ